MLFRAKYNVSQEHGHINYRRERHMTNNSAFSSSAILVVFSLLYAPFALNNLAVTIIIGDFPLLPDHMHLQWCAIQNVPIRLNTTALTFYENLLLGRTIINEWVKENQVRIIDARYNL